MHAYLKENYQKSSKKSNTILSLSIMKIIKKAHKMHWTSS